MRLNRALLTLCAAPLVLTLPAVAADPGVPGWGSCAVPVPRPPALPAAADPGLEFGEIEVLSGRAEFALGGDARFSDTLVLRRGDQFLTAQTARFDRDQSLFEVAGGVEYRDPATLVRAERASLNQQTTELRFEGAEFFVWSVPARGAAGSLRVQGERGRLRLRDVSYTSCPEGNDDWVLQASEIRIDQETGIGTAKNARLDFLGVPILYVPFLSYPATNQRKSGLLVPEFGSSQRRGFTVGVPWYWNIGPNYDATFTPVYMSRRGVQATGELRYLTPRHAGTLTGEYLADDQTGEDRSLLGVSHRSQLPRGWLLVGEAVGVSDAGYFEDFSNRLADTSQIQLERLLAFDYYSGPWAARLRFQDFQTLDDSLAREDRPYTRLPELAVRGYVPRGALGFGYALDGEVTWFERDVGVTGLRSRIAPALRRPLQAGFVRIDPSATLDYTRYDVETPEGLSQSFERTVPILGVDVRSVFERVEAGSRWLQTLEPRLLYTYIPFRDQAALPVFDTTVPDLNAVQLFRQNRFVGYDRIGDTNQLAVGVTGRIIRRADGVEFLRATVGQVRYFGTQEVVLPEGTPTDDNSSDYLLELRARIRGDWLAQANFVYNSDRSEAQEADFRVLYRPADERILSFGYRFRRDALEEIDIAAAWPLRERWNVIGRYNYSIQDEAPLESFVGVEYSTCCWGVRTVVRRNLVRRDGASDTSISLQLLLKGFSSTGTAAEALLGRGILGYR